MIGRNFDLEPRSRLNQATARDQTIQVVTWVTRPSSSNTMTASHYINENKSDIRGVKPGWYAIEDDGNLSSGPFCSLEECVKRIIQPTSGTMATKLQRAPN